MEFEDIKKYSPNQDKCLKISHEIETEYYYAKNLLNYIDLSKNFF